MKKILLLLALSSQIIFAQKVNILSIKKIEPTTSGGYYHPVFNPDNQHLLLSEINYDGLKEIDLSTYKTRLLTDAKGAGYGVRISEDGNTILFRKTEMIKNLKYTSLVELDKTSLKTKNIISRTRENLGFSFVGNKSFSIKGTKLNRGSVSKSQITPIIGIEDQKMVIYNGNKKSTLAPNGESASYIWPSFSPDFSKIVYTVAGKGTFVCDADGTNVVSLGRLSAPKWLGKDIVIGMIDKDNGQEIISSSIWAISIDGKAKTQLTDDSIKAIYPATSKDAKKIAFSTENGEVYLIDVQIK